MSAERDNTEFTALQAALQRRLPVLGICRGIQVLNVFLGGTLYQDIDRDLLHARAGHAQSPTWSAQVHDVVLEPDSRLAGIVGKTRLRTNSFHHQSVHAPAPSLIVTGVAGDGVIEAVEMRDYPWGVAVQWHPERQDANPSVSDADRRLFAAFGAAVMAGWTAAVA